MAFVAFFVFWGCFAWALQVSPDEVIEETARFSKLSRQTLELLYQEAPKLFVNLERLTLATKMVQGIARAQDRRVLEDLVEESLDTLRYFVLPRNLNLFLTAFQVYTKSLEAIRDYVFIPKFDETIYQRYRAMRLGDLKYGDTSEESKTTAFEVATTAPGSGYYVVRDRMYRELLKKKGYNPDLVERKLEKHLRAQIDTFWMDYLELRLQQELLRENEGAIVEELWQNADRDLRRLEEEARRLAAGTGEDTSNPVIREFRKLFPRWVDTIDDRHFGEDYYRGEVLENAREVSPGMFRIHYRTFSRETGELVAEHNEVYPFEGIKALLEQVKRDLGQ